MIYQINKLILQWIFWFSNYSNNNNYNNIGIHTDIHIKLKVKTNVFLKSLEHIQILFTHAFAPEHSPVSSPNLGSQPYSSLLPPQSVDFPLQVFFLSL